MEVIYKSNQIKKFERIVLTSGECKSFIPMSFVEEKEIIHVYYNLQGYCQLKDCHIDTPYKMLDILEKIILAIKNANNHLIICDRFYLKKDNIFVNESSTEVRVLFEPKDIKSDIDFNEMLISLLEELLINDIEYRNKEYLNIIIQRTRSFNLSKQIMINYIGELKRECYLCGWT